MGGDKSPKYQNRVILTLYDDVESHKMAKKCNAVEIELDLLCSIITPNREDRMQFLMQTVNINIKLNTLMVCCGGDKN